MIGHAGCVARLTIPPTMQIEQVASANARQRSLASARLFMTSVTRQIEAIVQQVRPDVGPSC